jgi:hypothetical protein
MSGDVEPQELLQRLLKIGESMVHDRRLQIGDAAIRTLRDQVTYARLRPCEDKALIDYQAANLVECIAAIAYARSERDIDSEDRAICYTNSLLGFMHGDLVRFEKARLQ